MSNPTTPNVRPWDGTNYTPAGDAVARAIFIKPTDGTNVPAVKAASTAAIATDPALVTTLSPNSPAQQVINAKSATSTLAGVGASVTSVLLLAANSNRNGATIANDKTSATLYIKLGATAAIASGGYTVSLSAGGYYEVPFGYTGIIHGIWETATGFANMDELTT